MKHLPAILFIAAAVAVLQANLSTVGWSIPCDAEAVTADLIGRAHAKTLTEAQRKAHEYIFLLAKSPRYYYDAEAVKEQQTKSTVARAAYGWKPASPERIAQEAEAERAVQRDLEFPVPELLVPRVNADWEPAGTVRVVADASNNLVAVTAADKRQYSLDAQREEFRLRQQQNQFTLRAIQKAKAAGDDVPALVARVAVLEDALVALLGNPAAGQVTGQVAGQVEKK